MSGFPDTTACALLDETTGSASGASRYVCLLTSDPGPQATIADIAALEPKGADGVTPVAGYARQQITFARAAAPVDSSNIRIGEPEADSSTVVTFGPFTEAMTEPANFVALVDSSGPSNDATVDQSVGLRRVEASDSGFQAEVGDTLTIPAGDFVLGFGYTA